MAKNITLLGADYPDVPAVMLPKTGGGTAMFVDPDEYVFVYTGSIQNFMQSFLPSKSMTDNMIYSATVSNPSWDVVYGWCMKVGASDYVGEFSNKNGYHVWATNTSGTYASKVISYT